MRTLLGCSTALMLTVLLVGSVTDARSEARAVLSAEVSQALLVGESVSSRVSVARVDGSAGLETVDVEVGPGLRIVPQTSFGCETADGRSARCEYVTASGSAEPNIVVEALTVGSHQITARVDGAAPVTMTVPVLASPSAGRSVGLLRRFLNSGATTGEGGPSPERACTTLDSPLCGTSDADRFRAPGQEAFTPIGAGALVPVGSRLRVEGGTGAVDLVAQAGGRLWRAGLPSAAFTVHQAGDGAATLVTATKRDCAAGRKAGYLRGFRPGDGASNAAFAIRTRRATITWSAGADPFFTVVDRCRAGATVTVFSGTVVVRPNGRGRPIRVNRSKSPTRIG